MSIHLDFLDISAQHVDVDRNESDLHDVSAEHRLAELNISRQVIPNQALLVNSILLLEAQASSEIENVVTPTDKLFRFAND